MVHRNRPRKICANQIWTSNNSERDKVLDENGKRKGLEIEKNLSNKKKTFKKNCKLKTKKLNYQLGAAIHRREATASKTIEMGVVVSSRS